MNSFFLKQHLPVSCVLLTLVLGLTGCGRNDIKVYRVAKEQPATESMDQGNGAMPPGHPDIGGAAARPGLKYAVPSGWEETAPGEMRVASFHVNGDGGKQADVGVFPFPGMAGGDLQNVNRWRGQVGLAPITEEEMTKAAEPVQVAGQKAELFDLGGQNAASGDKTRILGAILRQGDVSWFFKMNGDDALVAQQKPAFVQFLNSISFTAGSDAQMPAGHPPADAPMFAGPAAAAGSSDQPKPTWQVPAGWQETAAGPFLVAKYTIAGQGGSQAAVNVSLGGGGVAMNVNRWRGQLGLSQLGDADLDKALTPVDTAGGKAMFVDMTGTDPRTGQQARLVGAIVPQGAQTWFYKLMGGEQVVSQQKDSFMKFVQNVQYPK
ncbi:MAG TPA: hypothetical protein VG167_10175 [Verrucomicrobiae bacterium]|nr:hypothetical protein [Verrucomicrobiae bacterium]